MSLIRLNTRPSPRDLRVFGLGCIVLLVALGIAALRRGNSPLTTVFLVTAGVVIFPGLVFPVLLRPLYFVLIYATYPLGVVSSYVILALVYYLVFTPIGFILRLCGKDPLNRKFNRAKKSYWEVRDKPPASETYFDQH